MFTAFNNYRNRLGTQPVTLIEREQILNPILHDSIITKAIGIKMLSDDSENNDFLGYLLASGKMNIGGR